ncbi:hypothetical protein KBB27_01120 [Patescibacteria group bacterium]|nr:hypothetical protein [Patescibacteria group bacterium]
MADVKRMEGESLGHWFGRVRGEQYREASEAKKKAEQEVLERETMRARSVIEGMASAIGHVLAKEGTEKRIAIAAPGFVKREDLAPDAPSVPRKGLEKLYELGQESGQSLHDPLTPDVFHEKSALRMIVAACWDEGLDCWLTRKDPVPRSPGAEVEYGLAVSQNLGRIKRPKKSRSKK